MADRRIAGSGFDLHRCLRPWSAKKHLLQAPVLIAKRYFKMQNIFSVALKAEMAWLDYTGMNRADAHFMDFSSFHPEIVDIPD